MKKVIVWGSGRYYKYKAEYLKKNYNIIAFISKEVVEEIDGYPVISKEELKEQEFEKIIVMSEFYFIEIVHEILEMGIESSKIILGLNLPPATAKEAQYISKEEKIEINKDGKIIWNYSKEILCLDDIEECKKLHVGVMPEEVVRSLPLKPVSYDYGQSRNGESIARYYIDSFVREFQDKIKGTVMEIGDGRYTAWGERVEKSLVLVLGEAEGDPYIKGDLETGEGMEVESVDCFILTNVLSSLFDVQAAVMNVGKALKKGGTAIITVPGIASLYRVQYETYGQFWRFTPSGLSRLIMKYIPNVKVEIKEYGNVKTSTAFMYGLNVEDLTQEEIEYRDSCYPMVIGLYLEKY